MKNLVLLACKRGDGRVESGDGAGNFQYWGVLLLWTVVRQ